MADMLKNNAVNLPTSVTLSQVNSNVRGYATTEGLISAMDYYPYGTVVDLTVDNTDSRNRWQSKEFDGEYGKYYFGSRLFDPFFALWMSPDPAAQFANPYTYGGDPVNYVDPNGEEITLAVIATAAIVGAVVGGGTAAYQCSKYGSGNCSTAISTSAIVGAAAGAAGGAAGGAASGLSAAATGAAGLASGSGMFAAMAGGAVEGAVAGAASGATSYTMTYLLGETDGWNWGMDGWFSSMLTGAVGGGLMGGASSAIRYGVSDAYRQSTYQTVEDYGFKKGRHLDVLNFDNAMEQQQRAIDYYAYRVRGYNDMMFSYQDVIGDQTRGFYNSTTGQISISNDAFFVDGEYDPTSMMATVDHEYNHFKLNDVWKEQAEAIGFKDFRKVGNAIGNGRAFVEASNYQKGFVDGKTLGYSARVIDYLEKSYAKYMNPIW